MQKTNIEWVKNPDGTQGYSWNPIRGKCPAECKLPDGRIYCYGHGLYNGRLKRIDPGKPTFDSTAFCKGADALERSKPRGVFICSTFDLFHPVTDLNVIPDDDFKYTQRDYIFEVIKQYPRHRFYILTKFPQNIDRELPDNVWLGVSVTENKDWWRMKKLMSASASVRFISFEPLLEWIDLSQLTYHRTTHENKYNNGKSGDGRNPQGDAGGRFSRENMETEKTRMVQVGTEGNRPALPSSEGGKQDGAWLSSGANNAQSSSGACLCTPDSLPDADRPNSKGHLDQPQEWNQGRQQAKELRVDDTKPEYNSFKKGVKSRKARPKRRKEFNAQAFYRSCQGHPSTPSAISIRSKDEARACCVYPDEKIRGFSGNNFSGSQKEVLEIDFVIIGRLTGHGHRYDPDLKTLQEMVRRARNNKIPVFLKNNLSGIWPDELIQEMPG